MSRVEDDKRPDNLGEQEKKSDFLYFDPEQLLVSNPAGQIVNPRSIAQLEGKLIPSMFGTPVVVKVVTPEGQMWLVTDGLNRLNYAAQHKNDVFPNNPDFTLNPVKTFNATSAYLQNPVIVKPDEHPKGLDALTLEEYFRAVLPTTAVHVEIAPQRVAAHVIRVWESIVGKDISLKFSAVAALEYFGSGSKSNIYVANQTEQESEKISDALQRISSLLSENQIDRWALKRDAFMLVANQSQIIGGEKKALELIQGLMYHPEIERKLAEALPEAGERANFRGQLGKFIAEKLKRNVYPGEPMSTVTYIEFVKSVLLDKRFNIGEVGDILSSENPFVTRNELYKQKNHDFLVELYKTTFKTDEVSGMVAYFLERFGRTVDVKYNPQNVISSIYNADAAMTEADKYHSQLIQLSDALIKSGVDPESLDDYLKALKIAYDQMGGFKGQGTLNEGRDKLRSEVAKIKLAIRQQQCHFWVNDFVTQSYGVVEPGVVHFLIRHLDLVNKPFEKQGVHIQQAYKQFDGLDEDLRHEILVGLSRLDQALIRQSQRRIAAPRQPKPSVDTTLSAIAKPQDSQVSPSVPTRTEQPVAPIQKTQEPSVEQQILNQKEAERRRVELNNQRIARITQETRDNIARIDLDPKEYSPITKQTLEDLITLLGQKLVGHPDILRVFREWEQYKKHELKHLEAGVGNDLEEAEKDTRTKK